ncbi:MAG TPA: HAD-IIB family hydrolase, partial [Methylomirabilota bacterium]|nr:HAD-IIB family hydrolase [Methylomirabilota bacterium]
NGALIRDHESGRDLLSHQLPRGVLRRAWDVFAHAPVHPLFYRDDQLYCVTETLPIRRYCDDEGLRLNEIPNPEEFLALGAFIKTLFIGHPDSLGILREELEPVVGEGARLLRTRLDYLELIPAEASKGAALRHLAEHLGVRLERVIAVGDQENDREMIEAAGFGIAMPHAPDFVRAVADRVAPGPEKGGLLTLLRELLPEHFAR